MFKKKLEWVLTAIIAPVIASAIYDFAKEKPFLSTLLAVLKSTGNFILSVLNFNLRLWWLLIALVAFLMARKLVQAMQPEKDPRKPPYFRYQRERFKNWLWKWEWGWNANKKIWEIRNLFPFCPKCDIELLDRSSFLDRAAQCPKCNKYYSQNEVDDAQSVGIVIVDNVKKNRWE